MIERIRTILSRLRWAFMRPNNKACLEFNLTDAPMIVHAFGIAANTALMCGRHDAKERLKAYREMVAEYVCVEAKAFNEEVWAEMGMALGAAKSFHVTVELPPWRSRWATHGHLVIIIDSKFRYMGDKLDVAFGSPPIKALHDAIQTLSPMGCVGSYDPKTNHDRWAISTEEAA